VTRTMNNLSGCAVREEQVVFAPGREEQVIFVHYRYIVITTNLTI
jgi:hypothetical protein